MCNVVHRQALNICLGWKLGRGGGGGGGEHPASIENFSSASNETLAEFIDAKILPFLFWG